jgi:spore coat protein U domain-containing protein, fimbrial subunit CupE1/2/3/6
MKRGSRIRTLIIGLGALVALAATPSVAPVEAATATTTFQVTATVNATCLISATTLAFGAYTGTQTDATSTVTVTCTNTTPYNVGLNAGTFSGATVTTRRMTGTDANGLAYSLFQDSSRTVNWGNTVGTDTLAGTGNGAAQALTVYGRVPASQFVAPGSYTDTITATVTF